MDIHLEINNLVLKVQLLKIDLFELFKLDAYSTKENRALKIF